MSILASAEGIEFDSRSVKITPRMALAFAAGIQCGQTRYLDDARPGGLDIAPPICVSLEWLIAGDPNSQVALGLTPDEQRRAVHSGQDTRFHRPFDVGETVRVSGRVEAIRTTSAGALVTSCLQIHGSDDSAITTSLCDAIYRGVQTDAQPYNADSDGVIRPKAPDNTEAITIPIARNFPHIYSECASIYNPIHTERRIALAAGLPDIIVHGTALWALVWNQLSQIHGDLTRLSGRFRAMSIPGRPVTLRIGQLNGESNSIDFRLDNDQNEPVIQYGHATFARV